MSSRFILERECVDDLADTEREREGIDCEHDGPFDKRVLRQTNG
jgi:hypothetical protein